MSFWNDLLTKGEPIVGLSPMDGVTDAPMRYMSAKYGHPHIMFTEFVSVDALTHAKEEQSVGRVMQAFVRARDLVGAVRVDPSKSERSTLRDQPFKYPYEIAQVFGHTPELFYQAAVMIATLGFDGMDINMGCPAHKVEEQGSGAGLIRIPEVAKEIVRQAKRGMTEFAAGKVTIDDLEVSENVKVWVKNHATGERTLREPLPVSVKTRIGVDTEVVEWWMRQLMEVEPAMISLHGRTLKQLYQGSADWEAIGRAATVVHGLGGHLLGNGDVLSFEDGLAKVAQYGVDGFLIGRCAEGNPGVFLQSSELCNPDQQIAWIREHVEIYEQLNKPSEVDLKVGDTRWFVPLRKHLAWYAHGFPGAAELRTKLVQASSREEIDETVADFVSRVGV